MMQRNKGVVQVSTIDRALTLVEQIVERPMKLQEIAKELDVHKSSASRIVKVLEKHKFLKTENGVIYPGYGILQLAYLINEKLDIRNIARNHIEHLGEVTRGTIHLCILDGNEVVYIDKKDSPYPVRMHSRIGNRGPVYCTGVGKAILAYLPENEVEKLMNSITFNSFTKTTIDNREDLLKELASIKESSISIDNGEHEESVRCIAAPIFNFERKPVAAISISYTTTRNTLEDLFQYRSLLLETTKAISAELGFVPSLTEMVNKY